MIERHASDPQLYELRIKSIARHLKEQLPHGFTPQIALTLGSGLGEVAQKIDLVAEPVPYTTVPDYIQTTVEGHAGNFLFGHIKGVPIVGLQGRKHFYEEGGQPNIVQALREVTLPVHVVKELGANIYFATNAAGGLKRDYGIGDLMVIKSHMGLFFPNPLQGPPVMGMQRFVPQNEEYDPILRGLLHQAARNTGEDQHVHEGVYAAVTGPTFETAAETRYLRMGGVDAVGMSTVPEIIVATGRGMGTVGLSLITNIVAADGTNPTSHEEVMAALNDPSTSQRINKVVTEFFRLYHESQLSHLLK